MKDRPTVEDVARTAGVAVGTVSRVINGNASVTPAIREKVQRAIEDIGYVPNAAAQSMRRRATRTVGVVVHDIMIPALAAFVKTVQRTCQDAGYMLLLANTGGEIENELRILKSFARRQADGLIVTTGTESNAKLEGVLAALGIPTVLFERDRPERFDRVIADHAGGIRAAARHLLQLGHRRIALITGSPEITPGRVRIEGLREAYAEAGVPADEAVIRIGDFSSTHGFEQASFLLASSQPPSAIIAGGLEILPGVVRAIKRKGIAIPDELSLVGTSDTPLSELYDPSIAVIRWDFAEVGRVAAELLLSRIQGRATNGPRRVLIPTEFVARASCAPPSERPRSSRAAHHGMASGA